MARLFVGQREVDFFADISKELIKDVAGQKVYYYTIREDLSNVHEIYEESPQKIFNPPIEIEAMVETIQPTGADWIVGLIVSGKSVFSISSEQPKANVGQKVGLSFKLEGLHVFDEKDQSINYF